MHCTSEIEYKYLALYILCSVNCYIDSCAKCVPFTCSSTTVAGVTGSMPKVRESDNGNTETNKDTGSSVRASELAITSAASTLLTSSKSIFNFGHNSNQNNGSLLSSTSFSSFPPPVSNNFTSQNISSSSSAATSSGISATGNSTSMATISPATIASSNSCFSTPVVASSSSAISFFKFGSSPVQSAGLPVSSSGSEPPETKSRQDAGISGLSSTAFGASSGIFGFSSSAMTTVNSQSQSSAFGASSGSVLGAQTSFTSGFATSTQTQSVSFGSSASSSSFGLTGNPPFSSSRSSFPSSSPTASAAFPSGSSMFPSSSPATNVFNSGTSFGLDTSASSSAVNSVSSNSGPSSTLFGSSWQPSKSPFGSTFTSSSSSGFSFGGTSTVSVTSASSPSMFLSTSSASTPQFSFTPAAASTSTQPAFGSPNPAFAFGSAPVNNGEMSMEDSMAEDTGLATPPATAVYSQQPAPVQSNFLFGASTPSGGSPFQFGSQQNIAPLNPSPFQASGSLGGSFSLGTGGGDKSARRIVKVKHKPRKK